VTSVTEIIQHSIFSRPWSTIRLLLQAAHACVCTQRRCILWLTPKRIAFWFWSEVTREYSYFEFDGRLDHHPATEWETFHRKWGVRVGRLSSGCSISTAVNLGLLLATIGHLSSCVNLWLFNWHSKGPLCSSTTINTLDLEACRGGTTCSASDCRSRGRGFDSRSGAAA